MASADTLRDIHWRLHLSSSPDEVFRHLSTDLGRARFWAESAIEVEGAFGFLFRDGLT